MYTHSQLKCFDVLSPRWCDVWHTSWHYQYTHGVKRLWNVIWFVNNHAVFLLYTMLGDKYWLMLQSLGH